jgi:hypothetical protein
MIYRGHVKDGVIVLDQSVQLPEGAEVEVRATYTPPTEKSWADVFRAVIGKAEGLPDESSTNHDHYLHGIKK